ncbi:hypothetical protein FisN_15Hu335 [Fistulifera solaris]|uniref:Uncharacterized protein n=1 Tax=Fistulifera solaris TaxID=1519565 RepID=A0A1Z5JFS3_FISSO|nr:hypothetical protein FisN_15Hu335 [Fistulifera solaris]|eukprot:GAX12853.1 hypothetical protein FisN_15Hu335 [Fistulifera solaris]
MTNSSIPNTPSVSHRRAAAAAVTKALLDPPARPPRRTCSVQTLSALATSCPADFPLTLTCSSPPDIFRLEPRLLLAATSSVCDRRVSSSSTASSARLPRIRDFLEEDDDHEDLPPCKRLKMRSSTMRW